MTMANHLNNRHNEFILKIFISIIYFLLDLYLHTQTMISLGAFQFRVPVMQGFWEKYYLTEGKCGDFSQNLCNLAGQWGRGNTFAH
jgi:hypothetical protein